jgi:type IV pilus assembly protein PilN
MRFDINLATQPYEDTRRFYLVWTSLLVAMLIFTAGLISLCVVNWRNTQDMAKKIHDMRRRIDELDQKRAQAEAILNRPENRDVREQSRFLNQLIARKAFSWTQVFADLEKIMPPRLQVTAIKPDIKDDQLQLELQVQGDTAEPALELLRKMEESQTFRRPQIVSQSTTTLNNQSQTKFDIVSNYVPAPPALNRAAPQPGAAAQPGGGQP